MRSITRSEGFPERRIFSPGAMAGGPRGDLIIRLEPKPEFAGVLHNRCSIWFLDVRYIWALHEPSTGATTETWMCPP